MTASARVFAPLERTRSRPVTARRSRLLGVAALFAGHAVLGVAMADFAVIATIHALVCALAGLFYAATTRQIRNVSIVVAYVAGSEVLWRMDRADVFYEFGKYTVAAILLIALFRTRARRNRALAILYFALLVPSVIMTVVTLEGVAVRQETAFTMSGPLAITIAIIFFSSIRLDAEKLRRCYVAFIAPVAGIAAVLLVATSRSEAIDFGNASNYVTSGSFGPNQVSAMLGLAALFLVLLSFDRHLGLAGRGAALALAALFAGQSALTFARGGVGLALAAVMGAIFVLMRGSRRARVTIVVVAILGVALGKLVVEPRLDRITQGKLAERYSSTKTSGRELFISSELEMFAEHPIIGVGPGVGKKIREQRGLHQGPSHTEYTRMLAEHGIFGLASLICLVILAVRGIRQTSEPTFRAASVAFLIWTGLFLMVYGIRVAAPAVVFGLVFANRPPSARPRKLGDASAR
jgi:hypothetical protein